MLLDNRRVEFGVHATLNPTSLLREESEECVLHICQDIFAEETGV